MPVRVFIVGILNIWHISGCASLCTLSTLAWWWIATDAAPITRSMQSHVPGPALLSEPGLQRPARRVSPLQWDASAQPHRAQWHHLAGRLPYSARWEPVTDNLAQLTRRHKRNDLIQFLFSYPYNVKDYLTSFGVVKIIDAVTATIIITTFVCVFFFKYFLRPISCHFTSLYQDGTNIERSFKWFFLFKCETLPVKSFLLVWVGKYMLF